jgi:prefoldin subunit 5
MESKLKARLAELKEEYRKGQDQLMALNQEATSLNNTMLRISGAIQVLEELIRDNASANSSSEKSDVEIGSNSDK